MHLWMFILDLCNKSSTGTPLRWLGHSDTLWKAFELLCELPGRAQVMKARCERCNSDERVSTFAVQPPANPGGGSCVIEFRSTSAYKPPKG